MAKHIKIDKKYLLQKFSGKGGWTYTVIPEIAQDKKSPFGWVRVNGSIDGYPLNKYKLMPMGNGQLFLPVKAAIRKQIGKEAGDWVHVILEKDTTGLSIPDELMDCFNLESKSVFDFFNTLNQDEQKVYIDWVYDSKTEATKTERIVKMMDKLAAHKRFWEV